MVRKIKTKYPVVQYSTALKNPDQIRMYVWRVGDIRAHGGFVHMYVRNPETSKITDLVIYRASDNLTKRAGGEFDWDVEVYTGRNYVPNCNYRSYSRQYRDGRGVPAYLDEYVQEGKKLLGIK